MSRDTTVIRLRQPYAVDDPLSELAREGARRMLAQALIAEADAFVAMWKDLKLRMGVTASCVTAMGRSARSRPGLPAGADGAHRRMHAGADRRDP